MGSCAARKELVQEKSKRSRNLSLRSLELNHSSGQLATASKELLEDSRKLRKVLADVRKRLLRAFAKTSSQKRFKVENT